MGELELGVSRAVEVCRVQWDLASTPACAQGSSAVQRKAICDLDHGTAARYNLERERIRKERAAASARERAQAQKEKAPNKRSRKRKGGLLKEQPVQKRARLRKEWNQRAAEDWNQDGTLLQEGDAAAAAGAPPEHEGAQPGIASDPEDEIHTATACSKPLLKLQTERSFRPHSALEM